jgi:hypothetical protein
MKENVVGELGITPESFQYAPFLEHGGIGKAVQVSGLWSFSDAETLLADGVVDHDLTASACHG